MAKRKHSRNRKGGSRRHRFNPEGMVARLGQGAMAGFHVETAKMAGAVVVGGAGTMFVSNLLLDNLVSKIMKRDSESWLSRGVDFLATGLVAGAVAVASRYVMPYRSKEVLAGGMLASFSRLLPPAWVGGAQLSPALKGWSEDLGMSTMALGDFANPNQSANTLMAGMGDAATFGQVGAPIMAGMGDFANPNQRMLGDFVAAGPNAPIGAPLMAGMQDDIVAREIAANA